MAARGIGMCLNKLREFIACPCPIEYVVYWGFAGNRVRLFCLLRVELCCVVGPESVCLDCVRSILGVFSRMEVWGNEWNGRKERRDEGTQTPHFTSLPITHHLAPLIPRFPLTFQLKLESDGDALHDLHDQQSFEPVFMMCPVRAGEAWTNHIASIHPAEHLQNSIPVSQVIPPRWTLGSGFSPPINACPNPEELQTGHPVGFIITS